MKTIVTLDKSNQPHGFPQLDENGKVDVEQLPTSLPILNVEQLSGTTISGGTFYGDGQYLTGIPKDFLPLSGGIVTGDIIFQSGLTATTLNVTGDSLLQSLTATTLNADEFIKQDGTISQYLMADGSVSTNAVRNIYKFTGSGSTTGVISTVNLLTITISANTVSDYIDFQNIMFEKIGVGTGSVRLWVGSTDVFSSSTQIARFTIGASSLFIQFARTFSINNNQLIGFPANDSNSTGLDNSTSTIQLTAFDPTVTNYFFISAQLDTITDLISLRGVKITN